MTLFRRRSSSLLALVLLSLGTHVATSANDNGGNREGDCPSDPAEFSVVRLNAPLVSGGSVIAHQASADAQRVVYMADGDSSGVVELYSVPAGGGAVTKLNSALVDGGDVLDFQVSPDSATVVYLADGEVDERADLYSVSILGGAVARLTATNDDAVDEFAIVPDGSRTIYRIGYDLFSVPTTGGSPLELTVAGYDETQPGFKVSPDSGYVVFIDRGIADQGLTSIAVDRSSRAGLQCCTVRINNFQISADSSRVVWQFETNMEFYTVSKPITGGTLEVYCWQTAGATQVESLGVTAFPLDAIRVLYVCNYPQRLVSEPLDGGLQVDLDDSGIIKEITPDGSRAMYEWVTPSPKSPADGDLRSVAVGGGAPVTLNPPLVTDGEVVDVRVTPDGQTVVYRADQEVNDVYELYSVPVAGGMVTRLNGLLGSKQDVVDFDVSPVAAVVVYISDEDTRGAFELFAVPASGGAARKLNDPLPSGGDVAGFSIGADGARVFFRGDQLTNGVTELFAVRLATDADADTVPTVCDCDDLDGTVWDLPGECVDLILVHEEETTLLSWTAPAEPGGSTVVYDTLRTDQRDGFDPGSGSTVTEVETDGADTFSSDPGIPGPMSTFFYVVRAGNLCGEGTIGCQRDPIGPCP